MLLQGLVGKNTGRTDLHQIPAELALKSAILVTPKVDLVAQDERVEIASTRIVAVKARAAVALNAAVHFMVNKRSQVLVVKGSLPPTITAISMPGHDRHILQVTFAALVAHRTIMRMIEH
jgi:hypothetical protein